MSQIMHPNQLDDSTESVKDSPNNAMQPASQTTESPASAKKTPPPKHFGLLAILAIGVAAAAASFLKSKMEKAAAVASQVGAAVLKSKKAVFSAASAILGVVQPKSQKIAEKRLAKGKARLARASILALLTAFFAASSQLNAWINLRYFPIYERTNHSYVYSVWHPNDPIPEIESGYFSMYFTDWLNSLPFYPGPWIIAHASVSTDMLDSSRFRSMSTTYFSNGNRDNHCFRRNSVGRLIGWRCNNRSPVALINHKKIGRHVLRKKEGAENPDKNAVITRDYDFSIVVPETGPGRLGPDKFQVQFQYPRYNGESLPLPPVRRCVSHEFPAYPGPLVFITPCIPSDMSLPENGYIDYEGACLVIFAPPSDEDDE